MWILPPKMASESIDNLTQNIQKNFISISEPRSEKNMVFWSAPNWQVLLTCCHIVFYHIDDKADQHNGGCLLQKTFW